MAKLSTDELLEAFKELSLIELSEFVKKFEETFEVTAAAPVAVAAAGAPAAGGAGGDAAVELWAGTLVGMLPAFGWFTWVRDRRIDYQILKSAEQELIRRVGERGPRGAT